MNIMAALGAFGFALICIFAGRLGIVSRFERRTWLSFAGGVATAYVFVHLLPEIDHYRQQIEEGSEGFSGSLLYMVLLGGTCIYYGIESLLAHARRLDGRSGFIVHMAGFSFYFGLIGYFLQHRGDRGVEQEVVYFLVLGLHILSLDTAFRSQHRHLYDRIGRWVMAASVLVGWGVGTAVELPTMLVGSAFALLAGGMILNILRQELPATQEGRFLPFLFGALSCAVLLSFG